MKGFSLLIALVAVAFLSSAALAQQCNVQRQQQAVSSSSAVDLQNQAIANLLLQQQLQRPAVASASSAVAPQQRFIVAAPQPIRLNVVAPAQQFGGATSAASSASSSAAPASADLQALLLQSSQPVQAQLVGCAGGSCNRAGLLSNLKLGGRRQVSRSVSISRSTSR